MSSKIKPWTLGDPVFYKGYSIETTVFGQSEPCWVHGFHREEWILMIALILEECNPG